MEEVPSQHERRAAEIELLQAMYPDIEWNEQRQELKHTTKEGASIVLRIPGDYPGSSYPTLISALHGDKTDLRDLTKNRIDGLALPLNEELLDTIVQTFDEVVLTHTEQSNQQSENQQQASSEDTECKTVIVWLHHLLNTNKRKLALNPTFAPEKMVGVTKPGYPGILLYSGSVDAVNAHVLELRSQRWQAFQVRYDEISPAVWSFTHDSGIKEVETMSEVVQQIRQHVNQTTFLQAVGVK